MNPGRRFPAYGWLGLGLAVVFWGLNWGLSGPRTHWGFFPLWLGYCLAIDALTCWRTGTSLLTRSPRKYLGLFLVSTLAWWLFELINRRTQNWQYQGVELFTRLEYFAWASLSFTTVMPAVYGSAELVSSLGFWSRLRGGPVIRPDRRTTALVFIAGWLMLAALLAWPRLFFPFVWISLYFVLEPVNIWLGHRNLAVHTGQGNWRPVLALWLGVLLAAFFWEMWNYFSYPRWVYQIPWGDCCHIFEMPLLGYGGYLPFALELFALYHLVVGLFGDKTSRYIRLAE